MPVLFQKLNSLIVFFYWIVCILWPNWAQLPRKDGKWKDIFETAAVLHAQGFLLLLIIVTTGPQRWKQELFCNIWWTPLRRRALSSRDDCDGAAPWRRKWISERKTWIHAFAERGYRIRPKSSPSSQPMQSPVIRKTKSSNQHCDHSLDSP